MDLWITELVPENYRSKSNTSPFDVDKVTMMWLVQQSLPKIAIPTFDGSPTVWIKFVSKFKDLVHDQVYLRDEQRMFYLTQHLKGDAERSIRGFSQDSEGYVKALKRLKFLFGQRVKIAQAHLSKVSAGKAIQNDDVKGLTEFYYCISDCVNALTKMCYFSDLGSTDILRQAIRRLPLPLRNKWAEFSMNFRSRDEREPTLLDLEDWLQKRVLARTDAYLPPVERKGKPKPDSPVKEKGSFTTGRPKKKHQGKTPQKQQSPKCRYCGEGHRISSCEAYLEKPPSERLEFVQKEQLCQNCLGRDHLAAKCSSKWSCFKDGCVLKHHTSLHDVFVKIPEVSKDPKEEKVDNKTVGVMTTEVQDVFLQVVPIEVASSNGKSAESYALIDPGSQCTMVCDDLSDSLEVKGFAQRARIGTIHGPGDVQSVKSAPFTFSSIFDKNVKFEVDEVFIVKSSNFHLPKQSIPSIDSDPRLKHLKGLGIMSIASDQIKVLIGADVPEALIPKEVRIGEPKQPIAVLTPFGWAIMGPLRSNRKALEVSPISVNHIRISPEANLEQQVHKFWSTESFGTEINETLPRSIEDRQALNLLEETIKLKEGRYEVGMIWKINPTVVLENNISAAKKRYESLIKRLKKDPPLLEMYSTNMGEYVRKGYAVKVPKKEIQTVNTCWYLPHHPVVNPNKPGKVRVVFDAAAKFKGTSLNDMLLTGPDLLNSLIGVLLRFRDFPIAVCADIEAMFHQVKVCEQDTHALRFLWNADDPLHGAPDIYKMLVHIFGAKDSACCVTFALRRTIVDFSEKFSELVKSCVLRNFYADDFLRSFETNSEALLVSKELKDLLQHGGFRLTKFISNSQEVLESLPETDISSNTIDLSFEGVTERTLGVRWNTTADEFSFSSVTKDKPHTKRGILSTVSSIFDPLGFLSPFTIKAKLLLQQIWRSKLEWDEEISGDIKGLWLEWLKELGNINSFRMKRCFISSPYEICLSQLHVFSDASIVAFGCVAYLRTVDKEGTIDCSFVMAKTRVAPLKVIPLPRLELQAAVMAVRLKETLAAEMSYPVQETRFWSDSTIVLQYISNESRRFKTFVSNRVAEIRNHSEADSWSHVPGDLNPADHGTRGLPLTDLRPSHPWIEGPAFLYEDEEQWPSLDRLPALANDDPEIRKSAIVQVTYKFVPLLDMTRFSTWKRIVRVFAWVTRFLNNCRKNQSSSNSASLALDEINNAELKALSQVQNECFQAELSFLRENESVSHKSSLQRLMPFLKDGLIRVGGRLKHATLPFAAKHQIIIPYKHHSMYLILREIHESNAHSGPEFMLSHLREKFWGIKARSVARAIVKDCFYCKKKNSKAHVPVMSDLPQTRLTPNEPPFFKTGTDYFGPITVKIGRARAKRWGCIFTCLSTRAVHLELAEKLNTDSFINVLRRFISRRGHPRTILCDNGGNYVGASRELAENLQELDQDAIGAFARNRGIKWQFNPPDAPHMGGVWERLVRSVKTALRAILSDRVVEDYTLYTLLTEVESIINSRPLTPCSDDVNDLECLTPNHFLLGRRSPNLPPGVFYDQDMCLRKRWKQAQFLTEQFWKRWVREYLPTLTIRNKWTRERRSMRAGDLVLLKVDSVKRSQWPVGRIIETMPGKDGRVRVAKIKTATGTYMRPTAKMCLLESSPI